jgi:hypothetical protein
MAVLKKTCYHVDKGDEVVEIGHDDLDSYQYLNIYQYFTVLQLEFKSNFKT